MNIVSNTRFADPRGRLPAIALGAAFGFAMLLRWWMLQTGSPFITIDDKTAFEGGFLVWFGNAPPQRMYLESWIYGLSSLAVYAVRSGMGAAAGGLSLNAMADAYRDFYAHPGAYVWAYRSLILLVDLGTAWLVYRIAARVLQERWRGWAAVIVAALYLLSYNVLWTGLVARPDSLVSFFSALGLLLYLKSDGGREGRWLWVAAVALGLAAGLKLHAAFMALLVCLDLLRVRGGSAGLRLGLPFALISGFFFAWAAGSPFFDPLTYVKLRLANYDDDLSTWLRWPEHFAVVLRGTGWVTLPLALATGWAAWRDAARRNDTRIQTILLLGTGWLLLFMAIRPLRAYWMVPALPLFYLAAVHGLTLLRNVRVAAYTTAALTLVVLAQLLHEARALRAVPYGEAQDWIGQHARGKPFYILGYDALVLPKSTACIEKTSAALERRLREDREAGLPFTARHVKNWEERSLLALFDLLDGRNEPGFEFYDFYSTPPEMLEGLVSPAQMEYLLWQEDFDLTRSPAIQTLLQTQFKLVAQVRGAGGSGHGLRYRIYRRR